MSLFRKKPVDPYTELRAREDAQDAASRAFYAANGALSTLPVHLPKSAGEWRAQMAYALLPRDDQGHTVTQAQDDPLSAVVALDE